MAGTAPCGGLEDAHGGGADSDESATGEFSFIDTLGGGWRDGDPFTVNVMVSDGLAGDGFKGVEANVEGNGFKEDALLA